MMHHKGNERSQAYSLTGSYHCRHRRTGTPTQGRPLTPSLSLGLILTGEYRHRRTGGQENTDTGATTDTGDRLAPVARSCWLSLSRSMMMNTAKEMNAHRDTGTPTGLHPYRLLPLPTQEDRDTGGRQARSPSVLSLQENTDTGEQDTGEYRPTIGDH